MRKIVLFIAALLFMAVPVMAVSHVTIACNDNDVNCVTVSYTSDTNLIRAFGLDITTDTNKITKVVVMDPNYRIYPGQIDINSVSGDVNDYGMPYAPGDLGDANVTIEMGSLYTTDANYYDPCDPNNDSGYNKKPGKSGTLLKFYVGGDCNYFVTENALRGGIVMEDPYEIPNVTLCSGQIKQIVCTVPNVVGMTQAAATTAITGAGLVVGTVSYVNGGAVPIGNVVSQNPTDGGRTVDCGSAVNINVSAQCMKPTTTPASIRTDWVTWNKPRCWCYERNCRGDADGVPLGVYWVGPADLNLFKSAYLKTVAVLQTIPNGICADFDHLPLGVYRVAPADLNTFKAYYLKPVASVPVCSLSPNYYFWCTPPATCPANF